MSKKERQRKNAALLEAMQKAHAGVREKFAHDDSRLAAELVAASCVVANEHARTARTAEKPPKRIGQNKVRPANWRCKRRLRVLRELLEDAEAAAAAVAGDEQDRGWVNGEAAALAWAVELGTDEVLRHRALGKLTPEEIEALRRPHEHKK